MAEPLPVDHPAGRGRLRPIHPYQRIRCAVMLTPTSGGKLPNAAASAKRTSSQSVHDVRIR
jgi:hypothetical protein